MAETPTLFASSTTTISSVGTEQFLGTITAAGAYQLSIDFSNVVAGDVVELRVYRVVLSAGTARVLYLGRWSGAQPTDDLIKDSQIIGNDLASSGAIKFGINQTFGTARAFAWKIMQF